MKVGAGPVSFGVYEVPKDGSGLSAERLTQAMAEAGYQGAELPPAGYAGPPGSAARLWEKHGLESVGIYIPIHFADPTLGAVDEGRMEEALLELESASAGPRIAILADEGSEVLLHNPGRGDDPTHALGVKAFDALCSAVNRLAAKIRSRGLVPSFHPHISTYVESPAEVERLLATTDIDLTFDTGHIALGGGDVLECFRSWKERINHIHLKDVHHHVMDRAKAERRSDFGVWWAEVSTPLGEGDLPLATFLGHLAETGYEGWLVVEQDRAPVVTESELQAVTSVQARNLQWIRQHLWQGEETAR
jgi:inosose dehydratase